MFQSNTIINNLHKSKEKNNKIKKNKGGKKGRRQESNKDSPSQLSAIVYSFF